MGPFEAAFTEATLIEECRSDDSDLCHELTDRYGFTPEEMHRAAERYHLGRSKSGKTIYWMIDELGIVRDGHLANSWVSQMLKSRCPSFLQDWYPHHCLFGQHQLSHEVEKFSGKFSSDFEGTRPTRSTADTTSTSVSAPSLKTTPLPPRNPPKSTSPTSSSNSATIPPE